MTNKKLLIIDDEPINRFILNRLLTQLGFEVIEAENGQQAINILKFEKDVRVALLDLNMPVLDGYGFLNIVTNNDEYVTRELHIIIVSASSESTFIKGVEMMELDTSRVIGYMCKPVQMDVLMRMIKSVKHLST